MTKLTHELAESLTKTAAAAAASDVQVAEMRKAFYMGASHVFLSMMAMFDAEPGETANDMRKMSLLQAELDAFRDEATRHAAPKRRQ